MACPATPCKTPTFGAPEQSVDVKQAASLDGELPGGKGSGVAALCSENVQTLPVSSPSFSQSHQRAAELSVSQDQGAGDLLSQVAA